MLQHFSYKPMYENTQFLVGRLHFSLKIIDIRENTCRMARLNGQVKHHLKKIT